MRRHSALAALGLLATLWALVPGKLSAQSEADEVDVALVIAVDISYSMDVDEQKLQRQGYVEALTSPEVLRAITQGLNGKIAISYFEWADARDQRLVLDWTVIDGKASAEQAANHIALSPIQRARRTSISGALGYGERLFQQLPFQTTRKVIDVSGDGPNNSGDAVTRARDHALASGIAINGLPIMLKRQQGGWGFIDNLDEYYRDCVIGGPGAFVMPIKTPEQFQTATRQKIIREIASRSDPHIIPVQMQPAGADCMIGERMMRERWGE